MEERLEDLKRVAEQYYWNHSTSLHFISVMDHDFNQQMAIPDKFMKNFKEKLLEELFLKGPSGNLWLVKLMKIEDDLILKDGWKEFVEAHHIEEGDMLSFEYEGNSCFNVLIYDPRSHCEREISYLARNYKNIIAEKACLPKKVVDSAENIHMSSPNNDEGHSPTIPCEDNPNIQQLSPHNFPASNRFKFVGVEWGNRRRRKIRQCQLSADPISSAEDMHENPLQTNDESHSRRVLCHGDSQRKQLSPQDFAASNVMAASKSRVNERSGKVRKGKPSDHSIDSAENMHKRLPPNYDESPSKRVSSDDNPQLQQPPLQIIAASNGRWCSSKSLTIAWTDRKRKKRKGGCPRELALGSTKYAVQLISKRRPVTNEEREMVLQLTCGVKPANPFFRVVMRETHVYRRFFMTIPSDFVTEHLPHNVQTVDLRIENGKELWPDVVCARQYLRSTVGLTGAQWRNFVQDNNMEEGDACIFELSDTRKNVVFVVQIFRVVNEVIPLEKKSFMQKKGCH